MKTETIKYKLTDEDGNVTEHTCVVTYKRAKLSGQENFYARTNSERDSVGERPEFHSGIDRD